MLLIAIITCRLQFLLKGLSNEQIQRKKRNTSVFIVNDCLGLQSYKKPRLEIQIYIYEYCELTNHSQMKFVLTLFTRSVHPSLGTVTD